MKTKSIIFTKNFKIDEFLYETHGEEIELAEGDNPSFFRKDLIQRIEEIGKARQDEYRSQFPPHIQKIILEKVEYPKDRQVQEDVYSQCQTLTEQIETCTDIKVLESYRLLTTKDANARTAYNKRKAELEA